MRNEGIVLLWLLLLCLTAVIGFKCPNKDKIYKCAKIEKCYSVHQRCDHFDDCGDNTDEANCTAKDAVPHIIVGPDEKSGDESFAWLVTPVIFGFAVIYAIFKCYKEGLCNIKRLRRRAARNAHENYFAFDQVSFYSMTHLPCTQLGSTSRSSSQRQLMVVHNQTFSISVGNIPSPPSGENLGTALPPPSYEEVMSTRGTRNTGFSPLPQEDPDLPSYTDTILAIPVPPSTVPQNSAADLTEPKEDSEQS